MSFVKLTHNGLMANFLSTKTEWTNYTTSPVPFVDNVKLLNSPFDPNLQERANFDVSPALWKMENLP